MSARAPRGPRFAVVDDRYGAILVDHSARIGYPFMSRATAEEALAMGSPAIRGLMGDPESYRTAQAIITKTDTK